MEQPKRLQSHDSDYVDPYFRRMKNRAM